MSFVSGTAVRGVANPGDITNLGQGSFVTNSLSAPVSYSDRSTLVFAAATAGARPGGDGGGLSRGGIAGITIATVAVVAFIGFGVAFLVLRHGKLAATAKAAAPQPEFLENRSPLDEIAETARPGTPSWPVEMDGDHELRDRSPQELDGGEIMGKAEDSEEPGVKEESTVVGPVDDRGEGVDTEQRKL